MDDNSLTNMILALEALLALRRGYLRCRCKTGLALLPELSAAATAADGHRGLAKPLASHPPRAALAPFAFDRSSGSVASVAGAAEADI